MIKYVRLLRIAVLAVTDNYLIDDSSKDKKAKSTKKCVIKKQLKFEHYKNCLEATHLENEINYLEKK